MRLGAVARAGNGLEYHDFVDLTGFEPVTSCLPSKRSTN
jgi:hypothetical protein